MQAIDSPPVRAPSLFYWVSLVLAPIVYLCAMTIVDRSPSIDPALLRAKARVVISDSEQPPQFSRDITPENLVDSVAFTPVNASNVRSVWAHGEAELTADPERA